VTPRPPAGRRAALAWLLLGPPLAACAAAGPPAPPVRSLLEIRGERTVMQRWDVSCGAAALATLLEFQHGDHVTEREVALALIGREEYLAEPDLVVVRQGFSLLDLERYVERRGYRGRALGGLGYADLLALAPALVVVEEAGYPHFVVFRGQLRDRVLLADPAFGTRTMPVGQFERAWVAYGGGLGRVGFAVRRADGRPPVPPDRLAPRPEEFPTFG
jgi:predicted double-glycine peptidase